MMVSFGQSSGPVAPFDILTLSAKGSLYLTRQTLASHISSAEIAQSTGDIFEWIVEDKLKLRVEHVYKLAEAAQAHLDLEGRRTTGKLILEV
jgi:NADPH2:quinone reductase